MIKKISKLRHPFISCLITILSCMPFHKVIVSIFSFSKNKIQCLYRYEDMKYALKKLDDTKFKSHEVKFTFPYFDVL